MTSQTAKDRRNNGFIRKKTTNRVPLNIFRVFKVGKKVPLMFSRANAGRKRKYSVLRGYKGRNKIGCVYLHCKLEEDRYPCCIFNLKNQKTVETTYF